MLENIKQFDTELFIVLNGKNHFFLDPIMYLASDKLFLVPFYLLIFLLILKAYKRKSILIYFFIGLLITISVQISSSIFKPLTKRLRPSHEPALADIVNISEAGPGGLYGFVSGHATNSFALFVFLFCILDNRFNWLKYTLCFWAILVSYSRIYVGVHYPGDVLAGALLGSLIGFGLAQLFQQTKIYNKIPYFRYV